MDNKKTREEWLTELQGRAEDTQRRLVAVYEFAHQLCGVVSDEYEHPYKRGLADVERPLALKVVARLEHAIGQVLRGKDPTLKPKISGEGDNPEADDWAKEGHEFYLKQHERASGLWRQDRGASALMQPLWPDRRSRRKQDEALSMKPEPPEEKPRKRKRGLVRRAQDAVAALSGSSV